MFERFAKETRQTVLRAAELAEAEGSAMVEVEHLLHALVDPVSGSVGRALVSAGLSSEALREARDREFRSALALAGVATERPAPAGARRMRRGRTTPFAASAKLALERTLQLTLESAERRISNLTLLHAILSARVGIMPRLLDELGTNVASIEEAIRREV